MSEELKTLKDFCDFNLEEEFEGLILNKANIKVEAIKWGKFVKKFGLEGWSPKSIFDFFMDKLNVTEEDLHSSQMCEERGALISKTSEDINNLGEEK